MNTIGFRENYWIVTVSFLWCRVSLGVLVLLMFAWPAAADMGRIYVSRSGPTVSESAQKGIILHNNREEVLILGTELVADRRTPIVRFIPFPSEPSLSLAPKNVFQELAAIVAKYQLHYVHLFFSKGPRSQPRTESVEVRLSARLGAHDLTVIKVRDVAVFRSWVNKFFRRKGWPYESSYPKEEAIVADYVARGIDYFVFDAVDVRKDKHSIDPVVFRFKTSTLYYPLKTSNTFGGKGEIELFVISPETLCVPGSNTITSEFDQAAGPQGHAAGDCLSLKVKASTSAMLVPQEQDLARIYPGWAKFFGRQSVFIQSIRYVGPYDFKDDVRWPLPRGVPKPLGVEQPQDRPIVPASALGGEANEACRKKPDRGPCKGLFDRYFFDGGSHSCRKFIWGGCQGSVPFQSPEECQKACVPQLLK